VGKKWSCPLKVMWRSVEPGTVARDCCQRPRDKSWKPLSWSSCLLVPLLNSVLTGPLCHNHPGAFAVSRCQIPWDPLPVVWENTLSCSGPHGGRWDYDMEDHWPPGQGWTHSRLSNFWKNSTCFLTLEHCLMTT
jgi:hypothetical protein